MTGQRVVITRAAHQAEELARPLRELGADVISLPLLAIAPPLDPAPLQHAARILAGFDWLVFTSVNSVKALREALGADTEPPHVAVAAVGAATSRAAEDAGFQVAAMPAHYQADALASLLQAQLVPGTRILIPASDLARDTVPDSLRQLGAEVTVVEAYRNICPPEAPSAAAAVFRDPLPDWVLFASPSAVHNLVAITGADVLARCRLASIGEVTSEAMRTYQLRPAVQADPQTIPGLVTALAEYR